MKKSLLTLVSVMLTTLSALAQWVEPSIADIETTDMATDGTAQFLLNKEAKGFFGGGNDWNTRASVSASVADSVKFVLADESAGTYQFCDYPIVADKKAWLYVSCNYDQYKNHWVDASNAEESTNYPGTNKWKFVKQANGSYKFYNVSELTDIPEMVEGTENGYLGIAEKFEGAEGNTRCYLFDAAATYTYEDEDGEEHTDPTYAGAFWDEWYFVSIEAYDAFKAKRDIYDAAVALGKAIEETKANYAGIDLSAAEAVYNNYSSTAEELNNASTELIAAAIEAYVQSQIDNASLANPVNVTSQISGIDGTSITDWKRVFIGTGSTGSLSCNTWSVEATEDGMVTPFIENWVGAGGTLSDQKVYRDTITVKPGAYRITAKARLFNESTGAEYLTGAHVFANVNSKSITKEGVEGPENAIEGAKYGDYNGKLYYYKDDFEGYGIVGEDGKLIFGMYIKDANCNWLAHKNYQVYYLGNSYESLDFVRQNTNLLADAYDEDVVAQKALVTEYNAAVAAYNSATTAEALTAAYAKIVELQDSVANNIAAYQKYAERVEYISNYMANEGATLEGDDVNLLTDYLDGDEGPNDDYPNGFSNYILAELTLDTPEIEAELEFLENLYDTAIRNGMSDGTDLTNLIVNPGFEEAGGKGWSLDTHNGATTSSLTNWHGGSATNYCAEAYEQNFDVYQVIENVPNGLYEVSVQAFYRTTSNRAAYDAYVADPTMEGDAKVLSYVYFNSFASPVKNVMEIQFDENLASNCYTIPGSDPAKYTLDGMNSASAAFSLPDESMNFTQKVYGLVTDGTIRLGIRNLEGSKGGRWTLWDNFKLVYRAKNEEAIMSVLEVKLEEYNNYVTNAISDEVINTVEQETANAVIDAADEALKNGTADDKWNALINVNDAYVHTQEHVAAVKAVKDALLILDETVNNPELTPSQEALEAANELTGSDYDNLTNEEIIALTEKINIAIAKLKIPNSEGASEDHPVDFTATIVNNGFENGDLTGWVNEGEIAGQAQNNSSFDNKQGTWYAEKWHVNGTVNINQTVAYLPAGFYSITAYVYSTASDAILFANDSEVEVSTSQLYTVVASVDDSGELKFGVKWSDDGNQWTCLDEFTMQYLGTEAPTGIQQIAQKVEEAAKVVAIYSVSGAPVATLQKGLNIVKYADGSVKKIFVK